MTATSPTTPVNSSHALSNSLSAAWERMTWLLFHGPGARIETWFKWGLIILLAGALGSGPSGGNWMRSGRHQALGEVHERWSAFLDGWTVFTVGLAIAAALVAVVVLTYVVARFQLVFIDGLKRGEPRIVGTFAAARESGWSFFLFEIGLTLATLVLLSPVVLIWLPFLRDLGLTDPEELVRHALGAKLALTILWALPVIFASLLLRWFAVDLALPILWERQQGMRAALRDAWRIVSPNSGAVLLYIIVKIALKVAAMVLTGCVFCCTCCLWIWPAGIGAAMIGIGTLAPLTLFLLVPVGLAVMAISGWLMATITAPIPIFFRAWSMSFVAHLDPSVPDRFLPPPPAVPVDAVPSDEPPPPPSDPVDGYDAGL